MNFDQRERRYKKITVNQDFPLRMWMAESVHPGNTLVRWRFEGIYLPKGFEVVGCQYDFNSTGFSYILYHESWDIVPDGEYVPEIFGVERAHLNIEVFKITDDTRIVPYAKEPISDWRKLESMI